MNKIFTGLFLATTLLLGCSDNSPKDLEPFMVDISEFKIHNDLLKDGDKVLILGSSGNLTEEHKIDFYNLVVVKSLRTGDTLNVLVTTFFQSDLNDPETTFISNTSSEGKLMESVMNKEDVEGQNVNEMKPKSFSKVFYDTEYIQVDVRKYPCVTGNLGEYTIEGGLDKIGQ
ncbi:hypothetical protein [Fluviicola taffensis]|uniref:Lipoprotein n=1 Tax=Fluviicola taffensis (strain DSM 16823 / NCIMB 13979 / RW262) TaxID=755732 RepID=F2IA55_FLUTR|nr:hypothetical protein [Fluviicola taffensis]AEA45232.1 hypothetical protein Fluta_3259 [Fluviicola taffensis DSM 16823]